MSILIFVILAILVVIDYFKERKVYRLVALIPISFAIFLQTPLSTTLDKTVRNIISMILVAVMCVIFYLIMKDEKNKQPDKQTKK